jgi:DegV family protein with EDD domain
MAVRIITDSASDITPEDIEAAGSPALTVLPLSVTFGSDTYADSVDLTHRRFYELLVECDDLPKTGQVNPYAFEGAIREAREAGEESVVITVSGKLSGTYESAVSAASAFDSGVYVVDSRNVCVGERVLVDYALRLVGEGLPATDIAAALEQVRDDILVVGLLDTLEYLRRGGRVPAAAATVGQLLSIKPVISVEDGEVVVLGKARGSKNGRNLLTQQIEKSGGVDFSMPIALGYAGLDDGLLRKYIEDSRAIWEGNMHVDALPVHSVGATIGTHVGPGAIALAFFKKSA